MRRVTVHSQDPRGQPKRTWAGEMHSAQPNASLAISADRRIDVTDLKRIIVRNGLPGKTTRTIEYLVKGSGPVTIQYSALKGGMARTTVDLR